MLVLGIGLQMQLFMIAFASIWPVLFSTKAGVEGVDPRFLETGRVFRVTGLGQVFRIVLPSALPSVATGLRTASAIALVSRSPSRCSPAVPASAFTSRMCASTASITEMWAAILVTGVLGYLVNTLFMTVERVALPWSPENRDR